jgi:hypothetical protein
MEAFGSITMHMIWQAMKFAVKLIYVMRPSVLASLESCPVLEIV